MSKPLITVAQARQRVLSAVTPLGTEPVEIDRALGRVLAGDVRAQGNVPPFPSSAMDGGAVPAGATAVIPQEVVSRDGEVIETEAAMEPGENIRQPGEDMRAGATILRAGTRLGAVELGAAVAAGAGPGVVARMAPGRAR